MALIPSRGSTVTSVATVRDLSDFFQDSASSRHGPGQTGTLQEMVAEEFKVVARGRAHRRGARFPKYSYTISGEYDIFKCEGFTLRSARERGVRVSPRSACVILPLNPLTIHPPYEVC